MVWQEAFPPTGGPAFDAEAERERRLATQARAGAAWALTALIARYQPTVVRYLTRLCGSQAEAQRLAERIFQRMERRLHGPHGAENLRLWLLRACTEAGLDALRRPQARSMPRVGGSSVAGLLTEQSGADAPGMLRGGLRRLRKAGGVVQRQERPLVWADPQPGAAGPAGPAGPASRAESKRPVADQQRDQHLDEALDRLDPRDALRHRLVRVTLAELPYGDAQCLALHLVAGLNQAEAARALGITNAAARRRIVHGLALFSDRYAQAVQSLGLPVELGYGDALPRAPIEPEPAAPRVAEPVIVSAQAPDEDERAASADADGREVYPDALAPAQTEQSRDALSGVSYLSEDSDKLAAIRTATGGSAPRREDDYGDDYDNNYGDDYGDDYGAGYDAAYDDMAAASAQTPVVADADDAPAEPAMPSASAAPASGGLITRVASDAILGPIVDALPVTAFSPESSGVFGLPGPRSTPLAYELSSAHTPGLPDASEIRMHWLDDSGIMTPLTFEAVAMPSAVSSSQPAADDAPLIPLIWEATASHASVEVATEEPLAAADDAPLAFELAPVATDPSDPSDPRVQMTLSATQADEGGAGAEDDAPLTLVAEQAPPGPMTVPVTTPRQTPRLLSEAESKSGSGADRRLASAEPEPTEPTEPTVLTAPTGQFAPRPLGGVITRSLEDLWDEAPDGADF